MDTNVSNRHESEGVECREGASCATGMRTMIAWWRLKIQTIQSFSVALDILWALLRAIPAI
jgi:hypothetical protein